MSEDKKLNDINIEETSQKDTKKESKNYSNSKSTIISTIACILCLIIGFTSGKSIGKKLPATSKNYGNKVVATVGDTKFTEKDLKGRMEPLFYLNGKKELTPSEIKAYELSMIDYMSTTEALYLEGKKNNIKVTDEDIDSEYSELMQSIAQSFEMDEETFLKKFKLSSNKIKEDLKKELIATEYMAKESDVTDEEVENYFNNNKDEFLSVRASHILIKNTDDEGNSVSKEQKKKNKEKAENILKQALSGEDFATLARENSEDISAQDGGDLDFFRKGQMVAPFEKAAFSLKVGEIDPKIVESDYGYHIIKKTDEKYDELDTIREDLATKLSYDKQSNLVDNVIKKYNVEVKEK